MTSPNWARDTPRASNHLMSKSTDTGARLLDRLDDVLDVHDALAAIEEAEREGTISLGELRKKLGL